LFEKRKQRREQSVARKLALEEAIRLKPVLAAKAEAKLSAKREVDAAKARAKLEVATAQLIAERRWTLEADNPVNAASGRPKPVLIRTWRDAELVAADWMKYWGYTNVAATAVGADGGIDVVSNEAVAQVKAETSPTGRPKVQQHHGVAVSKGKTAIFFALGGFTPAARTYADENAILLFKFDLQGEPEPVNTAAHALMAKPC